jgi:hypothetical protein
MVTYFGYPSTVSCFDWNIDRACETGNPYSLPDDMRYHLIIQRLCHRITKAMSSNVSHQNGLPADNERYVMMNLLERDIDAIEGQLGQNISGKSSQKAMHLFGPTHNVVLDDLYLWSTRFYLRLFHFFDSTLTSARRDGILKSYAAAATIIPKLHSFDLLSYSPGPLLRVLFTAACVLLKVLSSNYIHFVDADSGAVLFNTAITALRKCSVEENDMAFRAADVLGQMWKTKDSTVADEEPNLVVQSRLGASVLFDSLWRWKGRVQHHATKEANSSAG